VKMFAENPRAIGTVLLDVQMPKLDGVGAMNRIRELAPDVRVILTSGMEREEIMSRLHPTPPWTFLEKPFLFQDLSRVLPSVASAA
jgi:DNA-binding NtrC family response regulator